MDELKLAGAEMATTDAGDGFLRIAAATPEVRVGDVRANAGDPLVRVARGR